MCPYTGLSQYLHGFGSQLAAVCWSFTMLCPIVIVTVYQQVSLIG